jgi:uncharacterized protein (TIGR02145 family)
MMLLKKFAFIASCSMMFACMSLVACGDSGSGTSPDQDFAQNESSSSLEGPGFSSGTSFGNDSTSNSQVDSLNNQVDLSSSSTTNGQSSIDDNPAQSSSESVSSSSYEGIDPATVIESTITDVRDGKTYKTVKIGNQTWMAENLNYDYLVKDDSGNVVVETYCSNSNEARCYDQGRLYVWSAALDSAGLFSADAKGCGFQAECEKKEAPRGVCFEGWHVPTYDDWLELFQTVGGDSVAAYHLKNTTGWPTKNVYVIGGGGVGYGIISDNGDNIYGFSVNPSDAWSLGEYLSKNGSVFAAFWTSTENPSDENYVYHIIISNEDKAYSGNHAYQKNEALAVRCIMD